ncbi:hypothetical protein DL771_002475 [Monosporascus sp. 5C6A]|nr:hypothetical protein DL771_002475 [Monosporascus sp. 5C6A]
MAHVPLGRGIRSPTLAYSPMSIPTMPRPPTVPSSGSTTPSDRPTSPPAHRALGLQRQPSPGADHYAVAIHN